MADWLFFDVGNVLFIDEEYNLTLLKVLTEAVARLGLPVSSRELMHERERLVREEADPTPFDTLGARLLGAAGWREAKRPVKERFSASWRDFNVPVPGCHQVLRQLRRRYRLAVAANQPTGCRRELERLGLLDCFDVLGLSEEKGFGKPDERFFQQLLGECRVTAAEATMVGDRIDNDIAPAQRLGLRTVRVEHPPAPWWFVQQTELASLYLTSLGTTPARGCGRGNVGVKAHRAVSSLLELNEVLLQDGGVCSGKEVDP